jgi:pectinesterase
MRRLACVLAAAVFASPALVAASPSVRVVLVGDSTMAPRTGYGDALCARFDADVECLNLARGGRSSGSYRAEGLWDQAIARLKTAGAANYVLIQFGHNDQPGKPGRSTDLVTEFPVNMARYVEEVRREGAVPVLVTPLTRRKFRDGVHENDLVPWAEAVRRIAAEKRVALIDLNAASAAAVAAMGSAQADMLAMAPPPVAPEEAGATPAAAAKSQFDHTHLGEKGAALFSNMVAGEIKTSVRELGLRFKNPFRPQLTDAQAAAYSYAEVLKYAGAAGSEFADTWDPLGDPLATASSLPADYVVDPNAEPDGKTVFSTVQAAIGKAVADAAMAMDKSRLYVSLKPGVYRELVYVPAARVPITLYGGGRHAGDTKISATLHAGVSGERYAADFGGQFAAAAPAISTMFASLKSRKTIGTDGSAIAWIRNDGFQARNLTFENAHNKAAGDGPGATQSQAVAVMVDGADRVQFENVRFIGFQDTLYLKAAAPGRAARSFFNKSYVEGNVDFIFGDATAYFLRSEIRTLGDRSYAYVAAPSTHYLSRFGFVFNDCDFTHDGSPGALAGKFHLARQWFRGQRCSPYGSVVLTSGYRCSLGAADAFQAGTGTISRATLESVGKMVVLHSRIGDHIDKERPWSAWNADGTQRHRPAQFSSDDYWDNLLGAGIDPVRDMGYTARKAPVEPFLAERGNSRNAP